MEYGKQHSHKYENCLLVMCVLRAFLYLNHCSLDNLVSDCGRCSMKPTHESTAYSVQQPFLISLTSKTNFATPCTAKSIQHGVPKEGQIYMHRLTAYYGVLTGLCPIHPTASVWKFGPEWQGTIPLVQSYSRSKSLRREVVHHTSTTTPYSWAVLTAYSVCI